MNKSFFVFLTGASAGSALTWYYLKMKYEKIVQEELESIKTALKNGIGEPYSQETDVIDNHEKKEADLEGEQTNLTDEEMFYNFSSELDEEDNDENEVPVDKEEYEELITTVDYANYSKEDVKKKTKSTKKKEVKPVKGKKKEKKVKPPYVITPEEFDDHDDYSVVTLTLYADNKLAYDQTDKLITDIEGIVGVDSLSHFGEYEDDSVFVRNDDIKCDFEILLDVRNYYDVIEQDVE